MFEPSVSVIVPVRNGEATIGACIASLLRLDYPKAKLEVIVVDNASTDRTGALLAAYGGEIRRVSERRRGVAAARNRGLRVAEGEAIAIRDRRGGMDPAPPSTNIPLGRTEMPAWSGKDERQYEAIKESAIERGAPSDQAKEIAGRTVNKRRREEGRTPNKTTQGTGNPNRPPGERTRDELRNLARELDIPGRSKMSKEQLVRAVERKQG